MSIGESIINYLGSGKDDRISGVSVADICVAMMFAEGRYNVVLQVGRRENIPYVRRALFKIMGEPSFETGRNELRYGSITVRIVAWDIHHFDAERSLQGYHESSLFYVDVDGDWEALATANGGVKSYRLGYE